MLLLDITARHFRGATYLGTITLPPASSWVDIRDRLAAAGHPMAVGDLIMAHGGYAGVEPCYWAVTKLLKSRAVVKRLDVK